MDELALSEPLEAKDLVVWLQGVAAELDWLGSHLADSPAGLVYGLILVQLVKIHLQELAWLGKAKWVKSARQFNIQMMEFAIV